MCKINISYPVGKVNFDFTPDGWPINPATGQPFSRKEIVNAANNLPYPTFVDPNNPGPYWAKRNPEQLAQEQKAARQKAKVRARRRKNRLSRSNRSTQVPPIACFEQQADCNLATAELVDRVNQPDTVEVTTPTGERHVLEIRRDYHIPAQLESRPIVWQFGDQIIELEVG